MLLKEFLKDNTQICLTIPLLLRLMEFAKEDAKSDVQIHEVLENIINKNKSKDVLDTSDYIDLVKVKE